MSEQNGHVIVELSLELALTGDKVLKSTFFNIYPLTIIFCMVYLIGISIKV